MPHTPGPWTIQEYGDDDCPSLVLHKGETENRVCFMATPGSHGDPEIIEADAKLISAAPDLLAALQLVMLYIADPARGPRDLYPAFGLDSSRVIEACQGAISKATA